MSGDGLDGLVLGAPFYQTTPLYCAGAVFVYAGRAGGILSGATPVPALHLEGETLLVGSDVALGG